MVMEQKLVYEVHKIKDRKIQLPSEEYTEECIDDTGRDNLTEGCTYTVKFHQDLDFIWVLDDNDEWVECLSDRFTRKSIPSFYIPLNSKIQYLGSSPLLETYQHKIKPENIPYPTST